MIADPPSEKAISYVHKLSNEIGSRPVGSSANHAAAGLIAAAFQSLGMMPEMLRFDAPIWKHGSTRINAGGQSLAAQANPFSPGCDVSAPLVSAGTLVELSSQLITDRVVLLYGSITHEPLPSQHHPDELNPREERLHDLLLRGKPAAVLFTHPLSGMMSAWLEDAEVNFASATVPPETALALLSYTGRTVTVQIDSARTWSYGDHVIARQPGRGKNILVLTAHFDTKYDTPGAFDNASGIATMLVVAERLLGRWMDVWVEYAAFNNGSYYGASTALNQCYDRYLSQHADMSSIIAAINVDGVGQTLGVQTYSLMSSSPAFHGLIDGVAQAFPHTTRLEEPGDGVHHLYASRGVPTIAIGSQGVRSLSHTSSDTADWLSPERLGETSSFIVRVIEALADKAPVWTRT
ncbi:MAG: M28 family peptidase [Anaerolineae bacterium]